MEIDALRQALWNLKDYKDSTPIIDTVPGLVRLGTHG